jgi:DNA-binding response OmpR family regulator
MTKNNILIVDDEAEVCVLLKGYLQRKNQEVDYSTSLTEGFEKFTQVKPNLLILDHNMPDGYGIENILKFKQINNTLKVVIISAMSNLKDEALRNGADYFLEKPINLSILNTILVSN